jgi:peptidoglycan/LPS O-acetylase OafA/YrhL
MILLGEISYGFYILQEPVFYWVKGGLSKLNINSKEIQFYAAFGVLLICATLTYKLIEQPIRKYFSALRTT